MLVLSGMQMMHASATGKLENLHSWRNQLHSMGPDFGFHANGMKTWLLVKHGHFSVARDLFVDTEVNITFPGSPYLGGPLGTEDYMENFVCSKVNQWNRILFALSEFSTMSTACCLRCPYSLAGKQMALLMSDHTNIHHLLEPLETTIRTKLIPAVTDRAPPNECLRNLFALPVGHGSLGIPSTTNLSSEFKNSLKVFAPLIKLIMEQNNSYSYEVLSERKSARSTIHRERHAKVIAHATTVKTQPRT